MKAILREYVQLWRDALGGDGWCDWFDRLLARLVLLVLHGALGFAVVVVLALFR